MLILDKDDKSYLQEQKQFIFIIWHLEGYLILLK